jgi:hypothetical protein
MSIRDIQIVVDKSMPLTSMQDDGSFVPCLGYVMPDGRLYVHPDRLEMLKAAIGNAGIR